MRKSVNSATSDEFLRLLRDARLRARLTQRDVAARLRRPQSFVAKYESGERRLDVMEFLSIAEALDADPVWILRRLRDAFVASER